MIFLFEKLYFVDFIKKGKFGSFVCKFVLGFFVYWLCLVER